MCATPRQTTCSCETEIAMKIALVAGLSLGMLVSGPCRAEDSVPGHIQNLQGCFRVSYRFVEDGKHDYEVKDVLEWITLQRQSGAYVIQHYGLIGGEVMQHFNETWSVLRDGRWRQDVGPSRYTCISQVRMGQLNCILGVGFHPHRKRGPSGMAR